MTVTINGTTGIDAVQSGVVQQVDLAANVAGNGPAFSAYANTLTALANSAFTKVLFQVEDFDTASAFDTSTGRFQPPVAGYYQLTTSVGVTVSSPELLCSLFKNGAEFIRGVMFGTADTGFASHVAGLIYLNGTTDYVEVHAYHQAGAVRNTSVSIRAITNFQGFLARAA